VEFAHFLSPLIHTTLLQIRKAKNTNLAFRPARLR
jgi:hypothetical protein